jgi:hypothetical protein
LFRATAFGFFFLFPSMGSVPWMELLMLVGHQRTTLS